MNNLEVCALNSKLRLTDYLHERSWGSTSIVALLPTNIVTLCKVRPVEWSLVLRSTHKKGTSVAHRITYAVFLSGLAASVFAFNTAPIANQDIATLVGHKGGNDWLVHLKNQPGQSIAHNASVKGDKSLTKVGIDEVTTGSIAVSTEIKKGTIPQRINRAAKGPRVVQSTAQKPPKDFNAGSILERHSMFAPLDQGKEQALAFVKPKTHEAALQVASLFHPKRQEPVTVVKDLPVMIASLVKQSVPNILAYAPEPEVKHSPFSAVLVQPKVTKRVPKLNKNDHQWAADPLPKNSYSRRQQRCLAEGIYFEARGERVKGQAAVSQVILNRVRNPHYPNSICGVVYQNKHWYNRCQFSFACDRIRDRINDKASFETAKYVARETTHNRIWLKKVGSSTHYHATYVSPRWARTMKRVGKIGVHIFYRTYGGGWS